MELTDVSEVVKDSSFKVFTGAVESGGQVKLSTLKVRQKDTHVKTSMHLENLRQFMAQKVLHG